MSTGTTIGFPKKIPPPIDQSCVGYWKLDEASGNIKDWSGNGNTGTAYNLTYSQPGKFGNACSFNGTTSYIGCGIITSFGNLSAVTVSVWVKGQNASGLINAVSNVILIHFRGAGFYLTAEDSTVSGYLPWDISIPLNVWTHIVATWDTNSQKMKLYQNGTKQATDLIFAGGTTGRLKSFSTINIGNYFNAGQPFFNGLIDEIRIYNRVLSPQEIKRHYMAGR